MKAKYLNIFAIIGGLSAIFALSGCKKSLSEVSGVNYNSETGEVSWDSSNDVKTYNLSVNGVKKLIKSDKTSYTLSEAEMQADDGTVDIEIEGLNDKDKVVEKTTTAIVLLPDMELSIADGYFDWSVSVNELEQYTKDGYTVKYKAVLNGSEVSGLLSEPKYKIPAGNTEFRVKAVLENNSMFFSNYSTISSKILETPTNINYDAGKITWGDVDFFNSTVTYKVNVEGYELETHSNYISLESFYALDSFELGNSFKATVQAISSEDGILSSEISNEFTYQYLDAVSNIQIKNGILSWDPLEDATKYQLEIDGNTVTDYLTTTSYALGGNASSVIRVRGWSDATVTVAKWSRAVTINTLSSPTPYFDGSSAVWSTVHNAESYKVNLNKVDSTGKVLERVLEEEPWVSNIIDLEGYCEEEGIYKFSVCACPGEGNKTYSESNYSIELEVVRLGLPTRFRITETSPQQPNGEIMITLSGTNEGAIYTCTINGVTYGVTNDNSFTFNKPLDSYNASLGADYSSLELKINTLAASNVATNNKLYLDSLKTINLELRQLNAPDNLQFVRKDNADYITWNEVADANGYGILFSNVSKSSEINEFALPNLASGNYSISVYSKGDILKDYNTINWKDDGTGNDPVSNVPNYYKDVDAEEDMCIYLTSIYSTSFQIKKLQTPTNISINSNDGTLNWDYVQDARGYMIKLAYGNNSKEIYYAPEADANGIIPVNYAEIDAAAISDEANQAGFVVEVYAIGNTREEHEATDTFVIDSEASTLNNRAVFHILNAPEVYFDGVNVVWSKTNYANGYTINNVKRVIDNVPYVNWSYASTSATSYAWDDSHDMEAGHYQICINAEGDFINYFNSDYSNVLEFTKLKTPELLHFDDVNDKAYFIALEEGALEYEIKITGARTGIQTSRITVENYRENNKIATIDGKEYLIFTPDFNRADNPTITVQAFGNKDLGYMASNIYQLTQITRELEAPINPSISANFNVDENKLYIHADVENPFGKGYSFYFNDIQSSVVDTPDTVYNVGDFADLSIKVGYEGNVFVYEDNQYVYYYDSSSSVDATTIYLLANVTITKAPSNSKGVFTFKFNKVTKGQYRFEYKVFNDTGDVEFESKLLDIGTVDQFIIDFSSYLMSDDLFTAKIYIYSIGNDNGTIISNPDALEYTIEL